MLVVDPLTQLSGLCFSMCGFITLPLVGFVLRLGPRLSWLLYTTMHAEMN